MRTGRAVPTYIDKFGQFLRVCSVDRYIIITDFLVSSFPGVLLPWLETALSARLRGALFAFLRFHHGARDAFAEHFVIGTEAVLVHFWIIHWYSLNIPGGFRGG